LVLGSVPQPSCGSRLCRALATSYAASAHSRLQQEPAPSVQHRRA
jgi:hypothetical protein